MERQIKVFDVELQDWVEAYCGPDRKHVQRLRKKFRAEGKKFEIKKINRRSGERTPRVRHQRQVVRRM